jgi:hypothetical protein
MYELRLVADGVQYGNGYPHITLHGFGVPTATFHWQLNSEFHVATAPDTTHKYDFVGATEAFFSNVDRSVGPLQQARTLAQQFWVIAQHW